LLVTTSQNLSFSEPLILFSSADSPLFEYFGWRNIAQRSDGLDGNPLSGPEWSETYNGLEAWFAPKKARLSFIASEGGYKIESVLTSEKPGLLSRYKSRNYRVGPGGVIDNREGDEGDVFNSGDECDC